MSPHQIPVRGFNTLSTMIASRPLCPVPRIVQYIPYSESLIDLYIVGASTVPINLLTNRGFFE